MKRKEKFTQFGREPNAKCDYCGKAFWRYPIELERNKKRCKRTFCNMECFGKWNKKYLYSLLNTTCEYCKKVFHRTPSRKKGSTLYFCSNSCQGKWTSENVLGSKTSNWQGGKTLQRKYELQSAKYRKWRSKLLKNVECILCKGKTALELHHIESRKNNIRRIQDETNVVPMCEECHDIFHSNSSKGGELRENLKVILAYGNSQPNSMNNIKVVEKVQRLIGEEFTNKPNTSAAPEKDDIVRAYSKE